MNPHRYGVQVMEKVLKMAEGIDIGETRSYELVPNRKLKRYRSPSDSEYPCLCPWPPPCSCGVDITGSVGTPVPRGCLWDSGTANCREVPVLCSAGLQSTSPSSAVCMIHTEFCLCLRKYHFTVCHFNYQVIGFP